MCKKVYLVIEEVDQSEFYRQGDFPEPATNIIAVYDSEESAIKRKERLEESARKEFLEWAESFIDDEDEEECEEPNPDDYVDDYAYPSYYIEKHDVKH